MENNFDNMKPLNIPSLDLTSTVNLASSVQAQFEQNRRDTMRIAEEAYNTGKECNEQWRKLPLILLKAMCNFKNLLGNKVDILSYWKNSYLYKRNSLLF